ncbi:DUF2625 family protein, partial [Hymenobacter terrestris]
LSEGTNPVRVLPKTAVEAERALLAAQVTTRSPLGAILYETGGLLVDGGWLRVLGSGSPLLSRSLMDWNQGKLEGALLIADDVIGGFYAINAGAFGSESLGQVFYFAPESLEWQALDKTYSEFLRFCFSGNLDDFYSDVRWPGWQGEIRPLTGDQGVAFFPFLFLEEGKNVATSKREVVSIAQLWAFGQEMKQQLDDTL